jgi:hypothetical protein
MHLDTLTAPATSDTTGSPRPAILCQDRDVAALFAEVEAILRAASASAQVPPAPPVTGCACIRPRSAGEFHRAQARPRRAPARHVRAMQRSPPTPVQAATDVDILEERQVISSQHA